MTYRKEIDGLRAIAVMAVIIAHSGLGWLPGGWVGVDVFFVISGFLITSIIQRDLDRGTFSFRDFYTRRIRRIFPALFAMLVVTTVLGWLMMTPSELIDLSASVFFTVLFLSNGFFIDFVDYFGPSAEAIPLLHTWSLAVEEQFYILFPAIAWVFWRIRGRGALFAGIVVLIVFSLGLAEWGWRNEAKANYFFSPSRFWEILLGSAAAVVLQTRTRPQIAALGWVGVAMLAVSFVFFNHATPFPSLYALIPTVGTVLLLVFTPETGVLSAILKSSPMRWIGLISFSAYLWHQPVFVLARMQGVATDKIGVASVLAAFVLGFSYLSWRFVEQPFRQSVPSSPFLARWRGWGLGLCASGLLAISLAGFFTDLPMKRHTPENRRLLEFTRMDMRNFNHEIKKGRQRREFDPESSKPKVAMVGDSFGRDFMHVLNAVDILGRLDFSLWTIGHQCAPFLLRSEEEDATIREVLDTNKCVEFDRYESEAMLGSLRHADVIMLSSKWQEGHAHYVARTVANIRALNGTAPILLVGPKNFGEATQRDLLRIAPGERAAYRGPADPSQVVAGKEMAQIGGVTYFDIFEAVCGPKAMCPLVDDAGRMISLDGGHLTPAGAALVARDLGKVNDLLGLFGLKKP